MLRLIKPGDRSKFYVVRGTVGGKRVEVSTRSTDKEYAQKYRAQLEVKLLADQGLATIGTYGEAAHIYLEKRRQSGINKHELQMHLNIVGEIGRRTLNDITQADIDRVADKLYPKAMASSKNRAVVVPIASVLHYAARSGHCQWLRIRKFKEAKPQTRAVSKDTAKLIIAATAKQKNNAHLKKALLLWLFKHGNRISEVLSIKGEDINFENSTFEIYISKTKTWKKFPLDPQVEEAIKTAYTDPKGKVKIPSGKIFHWHSRWSVYKWLTPMCKSIGIKFSPHVARHSLGTWFAAQGMGLRATMERLGHDDAKSSMRYQGGEIEVVREGNKKIGSLE